MSARSDTSDSSHLRNVGIGKKILVIDDDKYARTTSQTRRGIKVCFVLNSKHVKRSFYEFIETVNVSAVDSVEEAIVEIG